MTTHFNDTSYVSRDHVVYHVYRCSKAGSLMRSVHMMYAGSAQWLTIEKLIEHINFPNFVIKQRINGDDVVVYRSWEDD